MAEQDLQLKSISKELTVVLQQLIDIESEISYFDTQCCRSQLCIDRLQAGLSDSVLVEIDNVMSMVEGAFMNAVRRVSPTFRKMGVVANDTAAETLDTNMYLHHATTLLSKFRKGYRIKGATFTERLDILHSYGTFYDKLSILNFIQKMKSGCMSCEGIETDIYEACCDNELKTFVMHVINCYESTLSMVETLCIGNNKDEECLYVLACWLGLYGEVKDEAFIKQENQNQHVRHDNYLMFIKETERWLELADSMDALRRRKDELLEAKDSLIEKEQGIRNAIIKERNRQRVAFKERFASSNTKERTQAEINRLMELLKKQRNVPNPVKGFNNRSISDLLSPYPEPGSYIDSRDWSETK